MEVANAFSELNDPFDQRERFEAQARYRAEGDEEAHAVDEDYQVRLAFRMSPDGSSTMFRRDTATTSTWI